MNLPNLNETVEIISNWIESSEHEIHLNLCKDAIQTFIIDRFTNHVSPVELAVNRSRLTELIEDKKIEIVGYGIRNIN